MNRRVTHTLGWIIFFLIVFSYKSINMPLEIAFSHTLIGGILNCIFFYLFANLVVDKLFEENKHIAFYLGAIMIYYIQFRVKCFAEAKLVNQFFIQLQGEVYIEKELFVGLVTLINLVASFLVRVLENRSEREKKASILLQEQSQAQIQYLKSQINPHFLFNALNNIYALAVLQSKQTPKMLLQLSDLLRYSIYESQKQKILLSKDIEQIHKYLNLINMSKEEPLNVTFEINGKINGMKIEPMLLIPLVENSIKHGDFDINSSAFLKISLHIEGNTLRFETLNSKDDSNRQKDEVGGVGLQNIQKRLALSYPNHHFLTDDRGDCFRVVLQINNLID